MVPSPSWPPLDPGFYGRQLDEEHLDAVATISIESGKDYLNGPLADRNIHAYTWDGTNMVDSANGLRALAPSANPYFYPPPANGYPSSGPDLKMYLFEDTATNRQALKCDDEDLLCPDKVSDLEIYYEWSTGKGSRRFSLREQASGTVLTFAMEILIKLTFPEKKVNSLSGVDYTGKMMILSAAAWGLWGFPQGCFDLGTGKSVAVTNNDIINCWIDGGRSFPDVTPPPGTIIESLDSTQQYALKPRNIKLLMKAADGDVSTCTAHGLNLDSAVLVDTTAEAASERVMSWLDEAEMQKALVKVISGELLEKLDAELAFPE